MSHTLLILKIYTTFKDVQMILKRFLDISTGFRFSKISVECSVHSCSCPWLARQEISKIYACCPGSMRRKTTSLTVLPVANCVVRNSINHLKIADKTLGVKVLKFCLYLSVSSNNFVKTCRDWTCYLAFENQQIVSWYVANLKESQVVEPDFFKTGL